MAVIVQLRHGFDTYVLSRRGLGSGPRGRDVLEPREAARVMRRLVRRSDQNRTLVRGLRALFRAADVDERDLLRRAVGGLTPTGDLILERVHSWTPRGAQGPLEAEEEAIEEQPEEVEEAARETINVVLQLSYDSERPEAWDDSLRLFTTDDDGASYDQTVSLTDSTLTCRQEWRLLVMFEDVVPEKLYSCFLDLGQEEGGFHVFMNREVRWSHHVPDLERHR